MILGGFLFLLLGVGLYFLAARGFVAGSHPYCAACAYDLYMLPTEARRCPECGGDVLRENGIHVGRRRPSLAGMLAGSAVVIAGAAVALLGVGAWWRQFDGTRYMSAGALEARIASPDGSARNRTCNELARRIRTRQVSPEQTDQLAGMVLKLQADPAVPWDRQWGDLVEDGHIALSPEGVALLSRPRWQQYLLQMMQVNAIVRPRVTASDPMPLQIACDLKAGGATHPGMHFAAVVRLQMNGLTETLNAQSQQPDSFNSPMRWTLAWVAGQHAQWPMGKQQVEAAVTLTADDGKAAVSREERFTLPVEIVAGPSAALRVPAAAESKDIEEAVHWRLNEENGLIVPKAGVLGRLWIAGPPVACAFRVVLRQGNREWPLTRVMAVPDDAANVPLTLPAAAPGDGPRSGDAEMVCVPEPELAAGTVDVMEVWGGEVRRAVKLSIPGN